MGLRGRVAWVTGAGRGIGRACALSLADAGCDVGLSARSKAELELVAKEVGARGVRAAVLPADMTDAAGIRKAFERLTKELGPPGILVPAAGIARGEAFLRTTEGFMDEHWRLNVLGPFHCMQAALPSMLESRWGRVVAVASVAALAGAPYIAAYAASKHALLGLVRSVAAEVAGRGVSVNAVCPGYVDTKMTEENVRRIVAKTGQATADVRARLASMNPSGRLIAPEDVAAAVRTLCEEPDVRTNGAVIPLDAEVAHG